MLIISGSVVLGFKLDSEKKETPKETEKIEDVEHLSYDEKFIIVAPSTWKEVTDKNSLNEKAIIELNDEEKCAYVVVVMNSKDNLDDDFSSYKERVFKQKEQYYNTEIKSHEKVVVDGHDAEYGEIYYTDKNQINTYIRAYAIETDNYFGQIVIWTLAANEDLVQKDFDNIISSFKEIGVGEDNG